MTTLTLVKWSVDDYHRMVETGILQGRRVELLAGDIIKMSPETPMHYTTAKRGASYLEEMLAGKADVRFNGPITLSDSEPEPDIAIVRSPDSRYLAQHPIPDDIFWVVEVAKTSLKTDIDIKAKIYAKESIPEYWIVDLSHQNLIVFRKPQNGQYAESYSLVEGNLNPLAFPDVRISVEKLLVVV